MAHYQVRFYKLITTLDRHIIVVEADSPDAARAKVQAWGDGDIDLTDAEWMTEALEREGDVTDAEFAGLALLPDPYAVIETDADGMPIGEDA